MQELLIQNELLMLLVRFLSLPEEIPIEKKEITMRERHKHFAQMFQRVE